MLRLSLIFDQGACSVKEFVSSPTLAIRSPPSCFGSATMTFCATFPSAARMLSTLVTFSEKCCFLSVLWAVLVSSLLGPIMSRLDVTEGDTLGRQERKSQEDNSPCANTNIALNAQDSVLMNQCMGLPNEAHHFIPWPFCDSASELNDLHFWRIIHGRKSSNGGPYQL